MEATQKGFQVQFKHGVYIYMNRWRKAIQKCVFLLCREAF